MKSSAQEIQNKYHHLKTVIAERQAFEKQPENQISPWIDHPTTAHFFDVHGKTLLYYACLSGDADAVTQLVQDPAVNIEQMQIFGGGRSTPIEMALQEGYLEIAQILFEKGAKCSHILLSKVHPDCKAWFKEKLIESLDISWPSRNENDYNNFVRPSLFFENRSTPIADRLVEINDIESVKTLYFNAYKLQRLLVIAAGNGHIELVKFLCANNAKLIPLDFRFEKTALHAAVEGNQYEMVQYLLDSNALINYQNEEKKTSLMFAVEANNTNLVKLLLDKQAEVRIKDAVGENVLHKAILKNNPEIIQLLLNHDHQKFLLEDKNIYGFSSLDMAISEANDTMLSLVYQNNPQELENIKKSPLYGDKKAPINHGFLLPILHYYLTLNYRDTNFLAIRGHCYGFSFLRNYFTSLEKNAYFYQVLECISRWNGSNAALLEAFPKDVPQANYYANLGALLENWLTWIIWLHGKGMSNFPLYQDQIEEKFSQLSPENEDFSLVTVFKIPRDMVFNLTRNQLEEYLILIQKMPEKMMFNITGGHHSTSGNLIENLHYLDYYDANFRFKPDPKMLKKYLIDILLDVKYYSLNKTEDNKFPARFHIFYFNHQHIKMEDFILFSPSELPKSQADAENFQQKSPNKFTHLHAALITGSYQNMVQLLQEKHCNMDAKDSFGRTILDMAIDCRNIPMILLILKYSTCGINMGSAIEKLSNSEEDNQIKAILMQYVQPADSIHLCIDQIEENNFAYVENFVHEHKDIINNLDKEGFSLLLTAVEKNHDLIMNILIENGASVTQKSRSRVAFLEEPYSPLDIIIDENITQYFPIILNCSLEIHEFLDNFHKKDFVTCQKLLEEIEFDSENIIHHMIIKKLLLKMLNIPIDFSIVFIKKLDEKIFNKIFEEEPLVAEKLLESLKNNTELFITLIQKLDEKKLNALYNGKPLLVEAVIAKNFLALQALVACKAAIDNQTEPGKNTAFHSVLLLKRGKEWCEFLLDHGAKTDIENKEKVTAAHLSKKASPEIQALIVPADYKPTLF